MGSENGRGGEKGQPGQGGSDRAGNRGFRKGEVATEGTSSEKTAAISKTSALQKRSSKTATALEKEELKRADKRQEIGGIAFYGKLQTAAQEGSLKSLNTSLNHTHEAAMKRLVGELNATHRAGFEKLASELEKTWKEAEARKSALESTERAETATRDQEAAEKAGKELLEAAERAAEAQEKAQIDAIDKQTSITSDIASNAAQAIADSTKVTLDKQAEAGPVWHGGDRGTPPDGARRSHRRKRCAGWRGKARRGRNGREGRNRRSRSGFTPGER